MPKARSSKEKNPELEADTASSRRKKKPEVAEKPARKKAAPRREVEPEPEAAVEPEELEARDEGDERELDEEGEPKVRPVLTAMPRPVRDDELQETLAEQDATAERPPPTSPRRPRRRCRRSSATGSRCRCSRSTSSSG